MASSKLRDAQRCPPSAAPWTRRRASSRNAILEAGAGGVAAEHGFHRARIQDVAQRARIAVGTVYNHFEQKDDVLRALLEERTEGLVAQLESAPSDPARLRGRASRARIERMLHRYVETHRAFFTVAAEHGAIGASSASATVPGRRRPRSVAPAPARRSSSIVEEGIAAGALDPLDPAHLAARACGALFRAFSLGALEDGRTHFAGDAPTLVRLFLHGASRSAPRSSKRSR